MPAYPDIKVSMPSTSWPRSVVTTSLSTVPLSVSIIHSLPTSPRKPAPAADPRQVPNRGGTMTPRVGAAEKRAPKEQVSHAGHRNEVTVCGRLSAAALTKELPSGDEIVNWRLVVDRGEVAGTRKVDVVDCTTFLARVRRQAFAWSEGDVIEIAGAL